MIAVILPLITTISMSTISIIVFPTEFAAAIDLRDRAPVPVGERFHRDRLSLELSSSQFRAALDRTVTFVAAVPAEAPPSTATFLTMIAGGRVP